MRTGTELPILPGDTVLPPMDARNRPESRHREEFRRGNRKPKQRKADDRFAVLNGFVDCTLAKLRCTEIAVWLVLYRDTKPDGTACTSQPDIARRAGVSDRTVRNALGKLARKGLVRVVYRGGIGRGPSRYRVRPLPPGG